MRLPEPRGPLSRQLSQVLPQEPVARGAASDRLDRLPDAAERAVATAGDRLLADEDVQLSAFVLAELAYRGFDEVDDRWERSPQLLATRSVLDDAVEAHLRAVVALPPLPAPTSREVAAALFRLAAQDDGPSVSAFVDRRATLEQARELLVVRSSYHLKEADPHTWAIPRLAGRAKAALVEIQADEYGGGRPERMHAALFARTMRAAGLDDTYGAYVDAVPGIGLAPVNLMSTLGLQRRLRGAVVGHLAVYEMTSSLPNRRYGNGFRRLGFDADATWFFDEHVEADAVHEQIAGHDMAGALVEAEPALLEDVLFGAAAALHVDGLAGAHLLEAWRSGRSALRSAAAGHVGAGDAA